ncbi:conserved hypothetical protein [Culex quinquefasciatus]|uniref:Uncharacterized protein n=1 Tax=Culex quinquefasciatus TaxID=7176 RepID=B0WRM5_CULQU|nr:conserved hypothetical protein [Culex quinquefasciatus]|eukprot:XP_001851359.1 conserved hypothetical protein [Culex quinquefasciatus]
MLSEIVVLQLLLIAAPSQASDTFVASVIRLAEDLMREPSAVRRGFWFFKTSTSGWHSVDLLEKLLTSDPFASQPKLLFDELSSTDRGSTGLPTMVVVYLDKIDPVIITENPKLRHLIRRTNVTALRDLFTAVPKVGFLSDLTMARIVLRKQLNIDPKTSRTQFVMLEELLATDLMFHFFGARNTMRTRFADLQQRIYESGFMEYWMSIYAASQSIQPADLAEQTPRMIKYEQLQQLKGTNPRPLELLHGELVHVGEDLLQQTDTRPDFWFLKESVVAPSVEDVHEQLLLTEPFASHPKSVINERADWWTDSKFAPPTLVVVFPFISGNQLSTVLKLLVGVRLLDILYVAVYPDRSQYETFIYVVHSDAVQVIQYESLQQVFPDQTDLEGHTVNACTHHGGSYSEVDPVRGHSRGVDVELVRVIIGHLNGTLNVKFVECRPGERFVRCVERRLDLSECLFNFGRWRLENVDYGVPIMPFYSQVLVVARGEPLSVYELMAAPFTKSLWNLLNLMIVVGLCAILFMRILPQLKLLDLSRNETGVGVVTLGPVLVESLVGSWTHNPKVVSSNPGWMETKALKEVCNCLNNQAFGHLVSSRNLAIENAKATL